MGRCPTRRSHGHACVLSLGVAIWLAAPSFLVAGRAGRDTGSHAHSRSFRVRLKAVEDSTVVEAPVDFYELLGVDPEASVPDIKAAYRQAARLTHPDFFRTKPKEEREMAQDRFTQVNKAFEVLSNPKKRQAYDLRGLAGLAEFEFNGERIIMPPPWRVRLGYTGHHFWTMREYFMGFMLETLPDVSYEAISNAYEEATKDPVGVGQAILVERCTEKRAKDVVNALMEYGFVCMAEEVPDEELREEEQKEEEKEVKVPPAPTVSRTPSPKVAPKPTPSPVAPPPVPKLQPEPVAQAPASQVQARNGQQKPVIEREAKEPPSTWQWPSSAETPPCYSGSEAAKLEVEPVGAAVASQLKVPNGQAEKKPLIQREAKEPPGQWRWPSSAKAPPCYLGSEARQSR